LTEAKAPKATVFTGVTSGSLEKIDIVIPGESSATLTKIDGVWYTNPAKKHRVDKNAMTAIFTALEKEMSGDVVSTEEANYGEYQVSDTSGTRIKIYKSGKADPEAELLIGKDGGIGTSTYIRQAGKKEVVNARASLSYTFKRPDGWRDKQVFD